MNQPHGFLPLSFALLAGALALGCGHKEYIRDTQDPSIDQAAMGTGLDKRDVQKMLSENLNNLRSAPIMGEWRARGAQATIAIFPFTNETSQHIDSQLAAALSETEQWMIDAGLTVIDRSRQQTAIADIEHQHGGAFDPSHVAAYGKQLGVKYYVTGKAQSAEERTDDERRVQYWLFMQVIDVETSAIKWQHKAYVTKAVR